jgi:peptidoglycan-N-acetylglucosamine deacetylase
VLIGAGAGLLCGAAGFVAYAVRGRSASVFGPSVYRGNPHRALVALTFDDGPSESTPELLSYLALEQIPATFFMCGANVRRLPGIAAAVANAGHEIGNHSDTHPAFYFRSPEFIFNELERAQRAIENFVGVSPKLFRAPFGVRWFGMAAAQKRLNLLGVMWTVIGRDWRLGAPRIAARISRRVQNGAIICLHDGRDLQIRPDVRNTVEAVRLIVPEIRARGYGFATVSQLVCPRN